MDRLPMIGLNLAVMLVYSILYFLVSDEYQQGFPIQLAVYFSVHGLGLLILSMVQRALRKPELVKTFLLSGLTILGLGWTFLLVFF